MRLQEIINALKNNESNPTDSLLLPEARVPQTWDMIKHASFYQNRLRELHDEAALFLQKPISVLPYSAFRQFRETGSRQEYETFYFEHRARLNDFAILTLLDEEPVNLKALEDTIWAICDEYTWCLPAHLDDPGARRDSNVPLEIKVQGVLSQKLRPPEKMLDLFSAETAFALAEILNLLETKLDPEVVQRGRLEVFHRVIEPYQELNPVLWWETTTMNWAAVCAGSIGAAAMYLIDDPAILAPVLHRVLDTLECFISGFGEDGACTEGISYWTYGFGFFVYFAALLFERTGGSIDLLKPEKIARIATFQQQCYLTGNFVVSFSDTDVTQNYQPGLTCYLKKHFPQIQIPDSQYQAKFVDDSGRRWAHAIRDLIWSNPNLEYGLDKKATVYLPNAQWYISKHKFNAKTVCFAAKGGHNDEPHNHNDLGSFIFHINGDTFLADLGRSEYNRQYFNVNERYRFLATSSRGHSVPIINGSYQKNGPEYHAEIIKVESDNQVEQIQLQLAGAYGIPYFTSLMRGFSINKNGIPKIFLQDCYRFETAPESITERFISYYLPECIAPGRIRLTGKNNIMDILFSPEDFCFSFQKKKIKTPDSTTVVIYLTDLSLIRLDREIVAEISFELQE